MKLDRYVPFKDAFEFLHYCLINCRHPKRKDLSINNLTKLKAYLKSMCFLTHKNYNHEETDEINEQYWQEIMSNPDKLSAMFAKYDKCYKEKVDG